MKARIHDRLNSRFKNGPLRFWQKSDARRNIGATLILREDPDPTITFAWLAFNNSLTLFALLQTCRMLVHNPVASWQRVRAHVTLCLPSARRDMNHHFVEWMSNRTSAGSTYAWESRRYYTRVARKNYTRDSIKSHKKNMGVMPFAQQPTACISYSKPNLCLWRRQFGVGWQ